MSNDGVAFAEKMAKLKADYIAVLPQKLATIAEHFHNLQQNDSTETRIQLYRSVHNLIGTSGTFGLNELSQAARSLEILLKPLIQETTHVNTNGSPVFAEIETKVAGLFAILHSIESAEKINATLL